MSKIVVGQWAIVALSLGSGWSVGEIIEAPHVGSSYFLLNIEDNRAPVHEMNLIATFETEGEAVAKLEAARVAENAYRPLLSSSSNAVASARYALETAKATLHDVQSLAVAAAQAAVLSNVRIN